MSGRRRERPPATRAGDPREVLTAWATVEGGRPEAWVIAAWLIFGAFVAMVLVLGARPGGPLPVWIFVQGRLLLGLASLAVLLVGLLRSLRRPPFLQRRRLLAIVALVLVLGVANAPFPYPSSHEREPSDVEFRLPVEAPAPAEPGAGQPGAGEPGACWRVLWGGEDPARNRLAELYPDRRYGLHLVLEQAGRSHAGQGTRAEDFFAFGRTVLAPADGRVVRVHRDEPDREVRGRGQVQEPLGNLIGIEVAPGQVLFLTNLRAGSIRVEEGQTVRVGQALAEIGWSGATGITPEPHLALHLSDDPRPRRGEGIPLRFHGYYSDGRFVPAGMPRGGLGSEGARLGELLLPATP
jgi:murein DD-endopeptidase MepM/ murein hydrolase activator NlpD